MGTGSEHSSWAFAGLCKGQGVSEIVLGDHLGSTVFLHNPLKVLHPPGNEDHLPLSVQSLSY